MTHPIYDVVQRIEPGARCSTPPGRHGTIHTSNEQEARRTAARYNDHRAITEGLRYVVELHDEECPGRAYEHGHPAKPAEETVAIAEEDASDHEPEYTTKNIERGIDEARYLARRIGQNAWTVERQDRPGIWENITREDCPLGRHVKAGWSPDGRRLDISAAGSPPRKCEKTYDVYERSEAEARRFVAIGQVKGQTRGIASGLAFSRFNPKDVMIAVAGPNSVDQIAGQIDREEKARKEEEAKRARRSAREQKEQERERLARSREWNKQRRIERGEDEPVYTPSINEQIEEVKHTWRDTPGAITDTAAYIAQQRAATEAAIRAELDAQAEEENDEPPKRLPPAWHAYRPTDNGNLWAGCSRLSKSSDPKPIVNHRSVYFLGNGSAISWETGRGMAKRHESKRQAEDYVLAQGWKPEEIRAISTEAEPSIDDEPPRGRHPRRRRNRSSRRGRPESTQPSKHSRSDRE